MTIVGKKILDQRDQSLESIEEVERKNSVKSFRSNRNVTEIYKRESRMINPFTLDFVESPGRGAVEEETKEEEL